MPAGNGNTRSPGPAREKRSASGRGSGPQPPPCEIISHLPGVVYRCRADEKRTVEYVSAQCEALTGYSPGELMGSGGVPLHDLVHPEDREKLGEALQRALEDGEPFSITYRIIDRAGNTKWVEERGSCVLRAGGKAGAIEGFILDVTARHRAENGLKRATRALRTLAAGKRALLQHSEQGEMFRLVCRAAVEEGGYRMAWIGLKKKDPERRILPVASAGAVDGYLDDIRVSWEDDDYGRGPAGTAVRSGRPCIIRNVVEDASFAPWREEAVARGYRSVGCFPLSGEGEVMGVLAVYAGEEDAFDSEEVSILQRLADTIGFGMALERAKEKSEILEKQLLHSQKMDIVGQFAGRIAHDFNNLLTVINGYSDILSSKIQDVELKRKVDVIRRTGERAATLTRRLLAFSRNDITRPKLVDVNEAVRSVEPLLRSLLRSGVDLVLRMEAEPATVWMDPSHLDQILMNLAVNASDAMPEGGTLLIETARADLGGDYAATHAEVEPGPYVMVAVSDTGTGMERDVLEKVFDPFFTTKPEGKGTGLGLSIVYGLVRKNGGHVWVYSEPGKGTTFKVYFPLRSGKSSGGMLVSEKAAGYSAGTPSRRETVTVLVVDDEEAILDFAEMALAETGYEVYRAPDAESAMDLCAEIGKPPDLLLADVTLPGMSGPALAKRLLKEHPGMKVLFMSGYTSNASEMNGFLETGAEFLDKPFGVDALVGKVKEVLGGDV